MKTKLCSKCKTYKEFANFRNHPTTRDGKDSWCKDCVREDNRRRNATPQRKEYNRRYAQTEKAKKQRKEYYQRPEVKKRRALQMKMYRNDPKLRLRHEARWQISHRLSSGQIKKPLKCSKCNMKKTIQAHHPDYTKPLDIIWLCVDCHAEAEKGG